MVDDDAKYVFVSVSDDENRQLRPGSLVCAKTNEALNLFLRAFRRFHKYHGFHIWSGVLPARDSMIENEPASEKRKCVGQQAYRSFHPVLVNPCSGAQNEVNLMVVESGKKELHHIPDFSLIPYAFRHGQTPFKIAAFFPQVVSIGRRKKNNTIVFNCSLFV